jgi:hypothetical protein
MGIGFWVAQRHALLCEVRGLLWTHGRTEGKAPTLIPACKARLVLLARCSTAITKSLQPCQGPRPRLEQFGDSALIAVHQRSQRKHFMKRLCLIGLAASIFALSPTFSASAMPAAPLTAITDSEAATIQIKHGHGHKWGHRGGRGHHYGWGRGRGHHHGWRHHHRRW